MYNAASGRFLSSDTIVPEPGNPQSLNRYSYVNNNPLRYNDPTGHCQADMYGPRGCLGPYPDDGGGVWESAAAGGAEYTWAIMGGLGGDPDENFVPIYYCGIHQCGPGGGCSLVCQLVLGLWFDVTFGPVDDAYYTASGTYGCAGGGGCAPHNAIAFAPGCTSACASFTWLRKLLRFSDEGAAAAKAGKGFDSFDALKRQVGPAGAGKQWHHVVGQTSGNVNRFGAQSVHNTSNVVALDTKLHEAVSGYYSSKAPFTEGLTVRDWLSKQSFESQREFGMDTIRRFGGSP